MLLMMTWWQGGSAVKRRVLLEEYREGESWREHWLFITKSVHSVIRMQILTYRTPIFKCIRIGVNILISYMKSQTYKYTCVSIHCHPSLLPLKNLFNLQYFLLNMFPRKPNFCRESTGVLYLFPHRFPQDLEPHSGNLHTVYPISTYRIWPVLQWR